MKFDKTMKGYNSLADFQSLLEKHEMRKEAYRPVMLNLEKLVGSINQEKQVKIDSFFKGSTKERYERVKQQLQNAKENGSFGAIELLNSITKNFSDWLYYNNYGFVMDAYLDASGFCHFEVDVSFFNDDFRPENNKTCDEVLNDRINDGFEITMYEEEKIYKNSSKNMDLIKEVLSTFHAKEVNFIGWDVGETSILRSYSFDVDIGNITVEEYRYTDEFENRNKANECLDEKEFQEICKTFSDINLANQLPDVHNSALLVFFCVMDDILGINTETAVEYNENCAKERKLNDEIRKMKKELAMLSNPETIKEFVKEKSKAYSACLI